MDWDMDKIYGDPEVGMEWIGEQSSGVEVGRIRGIDESRRNLVDLMEETSKRRQEAFKESIRRDIEGMTKEEKAEYFADLNGSIPRICD